MTHSAFTELALNIALPSMVEQKTGRLLEACTVLAGNVVLATALCFCPEQAAAHRTPK
jgi:hypothetical protein